MTDEKPVLVLCGTGSDRENYLDDPSMVYGPFQTSAAAESWLAGAHCQTPHDDPSCAHEMDNEEHWLCDLGHFMWRDHSLAYLTAPEAT